MGWYCFLAGSMVLSSYCFMVGFMHFNTYCYCIVFVFWLLCIPPWVLYYAQLKGGV